MCREIIRDFDNLPMTDEVKPRVGVVSEILVKFLPAANNYVVDLLEAEGAEAVVPDLTDFSTAATTRISKLTISVLLRKLSL